MTFDETGYFITDSWWDNPDTVAVMSLEPADGKKADVKTILENAVEAMTGRKCGNYAKGLWAYDSWIKAVENDSDFSEEQILPLLAEKYITHCDAIDCITDGRYYAQVFMTKAAESQPAHKELFNSAAEYFRNACALCSKLFEATGGWERGETQMRRFVNPDVRKQSVQIIRQIKDNDEKAFEILKQLAALL